MSIPEKILQAGCDAYAAKFLNGNGSLGDGIEAAYLAIHGHDDWVRAGPPAWTGEGLPPVGTVCELHRDTYFEIEWQAVALLGVGQTKAFFRDKEGHEWSRPLSELSFRPIRTPDQIAADERISEIHALSDELAGYEGIDGVRARHHNMALYLVDQGYRKQASP